MIVSANENNNFLETVYGISDNDPFACRIISLYNSYPPALAFVDYWTVISETSGKCVGAAARSGTSFILFLTDECDIEEISAFMRVAGASSIICSDDYKLDLFGCVRTSGTVFLKNAHSGTDREDKGYIVPDIKSAYNLIVKSADSSFIPPEFDDYYVDVNHKLRHGTMRIYGVCPNNSLAAVAMTVAESRDSAVLGAVACDPDFRNCGYGTKIVNFISDRLIEENKTVYLHCADNSNINFYEKLGFVVCGRWSEYIF